ncbi:leucine-rich repeat and transmembrane domain-containing protein 2-like [Periplaneta americana]|uniref:leucine-rich repeat and transmembrane domain-containing protein 2-like n=1 Tax=Periplaneta americana TaxID=6978 RepID=UPI0037E82136
MMFKYFWKCLIILGILKELTGCISNSNSCKIDQRSKTLTCSETEDIKKILKLNTKEREIERIFVRNADLAEVKSHAFFLVPKLRLLDLSGNWLESLDSDVFKHVLMLKHLNLRCNYLQTLEKEIFIKLVHLEYLDISENRLTTLVDRELFMSQRNLSTLMLSENSLVSIDILVFEPLRSLKVLNLYRNKFACNCGLSLFIKWCKEQNLATNTTCVTPKEFVGLPWLQVDISDICEIFRTTSSPTVDTTATSTSASHTIPNEVLITQEAGITTNRRKDEANRMSEASSTVTILAACLGILILIICLFVTLFCWKKLRSSSTTLLDHPVKFSNPIGDYYSYEDAPSCAQIRNSMPPVLPQRPVTGKENIMDKTQVNNQCEVYDYVETNATRVSNSQELEDRNATSNNYSQAYENVYEVSRTNSLYISD